MDNTCNKCTCECHCGMDECPNCPNDVCYVCECSEVAERHSH